MTKKDYMIKMAEKTGETQKVCEKVYDAFVETLLEEATETKGDAEVLIPIIGKLKIVAKSEHEGRNPRTKEPITIDASRRAHIKLNKSFKEMLQ